MSVGAEIIVAVMVVMCGAVAATFLRGRWQIRRLKTLRRQANADEVKANYGIRLVTLGERKRVVTGAIANRFGITSKGSLVSYACNGGGKGLLQVFVTAREAAIWKPYEDLAASEEFNFAAFVGSQLRVVPAERFVEPGRTRSRVPLPMRGITVEQLIQFNRKFPGATSRDKQEQLKLECPGDLSYVEWAVYPETETPLGQLPYAIVSYSWEIPWGIMIDYLVKSIGLEGVVWIDILACNQNAIAAGDMSEIQQLPHCIEFIGQTYVMPGTLTRLWCIFEMAYSLLHNRQLVYYKPPEGDIHSDSETAVQTPVHNAVVSELLRNDQQQLKLTNTELLQNSSCYKPADRKFIEDTLKRNFDTPGDAVETIKVFVQSRLSSDALAQLTESQLQVATPPFISRTKKAHRLSLPSFMNRPRKVSKLQHLQKPLLQATTPAAGSATSFHGRL
jgi:hypothetical protein